MTSHPVTPPVTPRPNTNQAPFESGVTGVTDSYGISSLKDNQNIAARDIEAFLTTFLSIPPRAVTALTLFVFHTRMLGCSDVTPYLRILAPERESGKSTVGYIMERLCARAISPGSITGAALRRMMDMEPPPTLIMDELDPVFRKRAEDTSDIHQALNLGWKKGALATMAVRAPKGQGDDWMIKHFKVFGPKILISIGPIPETIESRSIQLRMERMTEAEKQGKLKWRDRLGNQMAAPILTMLEVIDYPAELPIPDMPEELSGRQQDIWEPLIAIADWLGGEWPAKARQAAKEIHAKKEDDSPGIALLRHIREVFDTVPNDGGLYSQRLLDELLANEEWPWTHSEGGRPLTTAYLAEKLRAFGIRPKPIRLYDFGGTQQRGYYRFTFDNAWERYL